MFSNLDPNAFFRFQRRRYDGCGDHLPSRSGQDSATVVDGVVPDVQVCVRAPGDEPDAADVQVQHVYIAAHAHRHDDDGTVGRRTLEQDESLLVSEVGEATGVVSS